MPIKFRCPHCEQFLGISESKAGSVTDCPTCGHTLRVPELDGTVNPLPPPSLNYNDQELLTALGALANLATQEVSESPLPVPVAVFAPARGTSVFPVEVVTRPETGDSILAIPVAHVEDSPEISGSLEDALAELVEQPVSESAVVEPKPVDPRFRPASMFGAVALSLLCGILIGLALRSKSHPSTSAVSDPVSEVNGIREAGSEESPAPRPHVAIAEVRGQVTYAGVANEQKPDRGARILVLPLERRGTSKVDGLGFRVGASEEDQHLLESAATVWGGRFEVADSEGKYSAVVPAAGRYGMLIASRYQSRPASISLSQECRKFLSQYFDSPEAILGNIEFQFHELTLDPEAPVVRDVQFHQR
ncbi:hypothetical protein SH661x_003442 [Planctomicrobium sp. SH661]|uniref:hypothetical protein n=1 Tax=Planctomicrobium sp. SH661 TaxID=3448124 RepID=UPI003F5AE7F3